MHRRLQSGMRENPASDRRHGSPLALSGIANENYTGVDSLKLSGPDPTHDQSVAANFSARDAAPPCADTGAEKDVAADGSTAAMHTAFFARMKQSFEPLIGSCEAARLLGNIHVKTLQRYARHQRVPAYQIGGHWYFRASELDSWLRSQINLPCHPCRLQEKSDGT